MTREEAIKILSCRDNRGCPVVWQDGYVDAVDMAIEALSTDIVRCKDCVHGEIDDPEFPNQYFCRYKGLDWNDGEHFCSDGCLPEIMTPPKGEQDV